MTDKIAQAQAQIREAEARLENAKRMLEQAQAEDIPPEPKSRFIHFSIAFSIPGRYYNYAAIKADGRWYVTGERSQNGVTWPELVKWMRARHTGPSISVYELSSGFGSVQVDMDIR